MRCADDERDTRGLHQHLQHRGELVGERALAVAGRAVDHAAERRLTEALERRDVADVRLPEERDAVTLAVRDEGDGPDDLLRERRGLADGGLSDLDGHAGWAMHSLCPGTGACLTGDR